MTEVELYTYYKSMIKWYLYQNGNGWEESIDGFIKKHTEGYPSSESHCFVTISHGNLKMPKHILSDSYAGIIGYNNNPPTIFQAPTSHIKDCITKEEEDFIILSKEKFFEVNTPIKDRVVKYEKFETETLQEEDK